MHEFKIKYKVELAACAVGSICVFFS